MAIEDLTTYTLSSAGGTIGVTSTRATATAFSTRTASGVVQSDKGAAHFSGDFTHLLTFYWDPDIPSSQTFGAWMLSNVTGDLHASDSVDSPAMYLVVSDNDNPQKMKLGDYRSSTYNEDVWQGPDNAIIYYLKIERIGTALTCRVYDDSGRTNLLHTLAITLASATSFRYVGVVLGYNDGGTSGVVSGYVENLDLQEGGGGGGGTADKPGNMLLMFR